jgi:hypothetical protein
VLQAVKDDYNAIMEFLNRYCKDKLCENCSNRGACIQAGQMQEQYRIR